MRIHFALKERESARKKENSFEKIPQEEERRLLKVPREHPSSNSVASQVEIPSNKEQSEQARQVGGGVEKAGRALVSCCTITFGASPYQPFK